MRRWPSILLCFGVGVLLLVAPAARSAAGARRVDVQVFFASNPASYSDPTFVVPVIRLTTRADVATFAIEQLIAGPSQSESARGLFAPIRLTGWSNCTGRDFMLSIAQGRRVATLEFCRRVSSSGVGDDILIQTSIRRTLRQFPTVSSVIILTENSRCFGDVSGADTCRKP